MWIIELQNEDPSETLFFGPYSDEAMAIHDLEDAVLIDLILTDTSVESGFIEARMCYINSPSDAQSMGHLGD